MIFLRILNLLTNIFIVLSLDQPFQIFGGNDPGACDTVLSYSDNNEDSSGGLVLVGGYTYSPTLVTGVNSTICYTNPVPFVLLKDAGNSTPLWVHYFSNAKLMMVQGTAYLGYPKEVIYVGFPLKILPPNIKSRTILTTKIGVVVKYSINIPGMSMYYLLDSTTGKPFHSYPIPLSLADIKIQPHLTFDSTNTIRFFLPFSEVVNGILNYGVLVFKDSQHPIKLYQTTSQIDSVGTTSVYHIGTNVFFGGGLISQVSGTMKPFITFINLQTLQPVWSKQIDSIDTSSEYSQSHHYIEIMETTRLKKIAWAGFSERDLNLDLKEYGYQYGLMIEYTKTDFTSFCNVFTLVTHKKTTDFKYRSIQSIQPQGMYEFQYNYVVGDDLDDVKQGKVGKSGYETSFDAMNPDECFESNKTVKFYTKTDAWIDSTWGTPPKQFSFWVGRACYQHTSADPICMNLITDFRLNMPHTTWLTMHSVFLATASHYFSDSVRDSGDEGAQMKTGEPNGQIIPVNQVNGKTGKSIIFGEFKGGSHSGNHDSVQSMRVENEFLQYFSLPLPTSLTMSISTCSNLSIKGAITIQKEFFNLPLNITFQVIRDQFINLQDTIAGISIDTGTSGYINTTIFTLNRDLSITINSRQTTVDSEIREQTFSILISAECQQVGSSSFQTTVILPLQISLTDCQLQQLVAQQGVIKISLQPGQGKVQVFSGTEVQSYFSLKYPDRCSQITYDLMTYINQAYQTLSYPISEVVLNSDNSISVNSDSSLSSLSIAVRATDLNGGQAFKIINIDKCKNQRLVASDGTIKISLKSGQGKIQVLSGTYVQSFFSLKYPGRCEIAAWNIDIASLLGQFENSSQNQLAYLNPDNSLIINTNSSREGFELMIRARMNDTFLASKIIEVTFVNVTSEKTDEVLSEQTNSSSSSESNRTQELSKVRKYQKKLVQKRLESKQIQVNEPVRNISIYFQEVSTTGLITLNFSESLQSIDHMNPLQLEDLQTPEFITINYTSFLNLSDERSTNQTIPKLNSWKVVEFSEAYLKIQLNFSNPELVSISWNPDKIQLRIEEPLLFQSLQTNKTLENKLFFNINIPGQVQSEEEQRMIVQVAQTLESSLLFFLLLHLAMKLFGKVDMDLMWTLISMLQLIISFVKINGFIMPANLSQILGLQSRIVYFKLFEYPEVKNIIDNSMSIVRSTILFIGDEFIILAVILVTLALVLLLGLCVKKVDKLREKLDSIKKKLVWAPIITFFLQSYYPLSLSSLKVVSNPPSQYSLITSSIKTLFLLMFPMSGYLLLRKNKDKLKDDEFVNRYGQLYLGVKQVVGETQLTIIRELGFKFTISLIVVFVHSSIALPLLALLSLMAASWQLSAWRSYNRREVGVMKALNAIYLLVISVSLMMMTELVADGAIRYQVGEQMMWSLVFMIGLNISVLIKVRIDEIWTFVAKKLAQREQLKQSSLENVESQIQIEPRNNQEVQENVNQQPTSQQPDEQEESSSDDSEGGEDEQEELESPRFQEEIKENTKIELKVRSSFGFGNLLERKNTVQNITQDSQQEQIIEMADQIPKQVIKIPPALNICPISEELTVDQKPKKDNFNIHKYEELITDIEMGDKEKVKEDEQMGPFTFRN